MQFINEQKNRYELELEDGTVLVKLSRQKIAVRKCIDCNKATRHEIEIISINKKSYLKSIFCLKCCSYTSITIPSIRRIRQI